MVMKEINSYPSIYAIGHRQIRDIFAGDVVIEEKVDGSQFSMARIDGELYCRSKGKMIVTDAPEKMFSRAVEVAESLPLHDGWVYRGEYLGTPKHNTLSYDRTPRNHIALFDVQTGPEVYLNCGEKWDEANRIGVDCVPVLAVGKVDSLESLMGFLARDSFLGGTKIEGFVVKNYELFTADKKVAMGKYVSEVFKEKHVSEWKSSNPGRNDVIVRLVEELRTEARWRKAVEHLRDDGGLEGSPRDIGKIIKEIPEDILRDSEADIRDRLFNHFWPQIRRAVTAGAPEWYKQRLAESAFADEAE